MTSATMLSAAAAADPGDRPDPGEPYRLLLIEDDAAQARALGRWLETTGDYAVTTAASGYAAEAYLKSGVRWDAVVSDIDLPGMNGLQVLRLCKIHQPSAPVLMVTAHRKFDYVLDAMRQHADDFLVKPLSKDAFLEGVGALIEKPRSAAPVPTETVLAIGAHPDDVEIGCGGILLSHARRGDRVVIAVLTGGEAGGAKRERAQEARRAAQAIGAELRMFDLPDRSVSEGPDTISVLEKVIREVGPTTIYTHTNNDAHQDHRAVHSATLVAARGVPNLYCYQAPSTTVDFRPSLFMNVKQQLERKLQVLSLYETQTKVRPYLKPEHVRSSAEYWGRFSQYEAAEPLEVVRKSE